MHSSGIYSVRRDPKIQTVSGCNIHSLKEKWLFNVLSTVIELKSHAVEIGGIAVDPCAEWMKQVARNLTDPVDGFPLTWPALWPAS
jgi:hypothetical protein